ncbi:SAM-dependent methyltransferase [Pseudonocardiaceae bacterium YIM PH 21723]|nr:SAM-dependent methyltransferase [Pseudonocardiaceae bacterium YIM PH 21723]
MNPLFSDAFCDQLRSHFQAAEYTTDGVIDLLGPDVHAALGRGETEPARRMLGADALDTLVRIFLLGDSASDTTAAKALPVEEALAAGLLERSAGEVRSALDARPYGDDLGSWWVISDLDPEARTQRGTGTGADHVLGIGHASTSLARATSRTPVGSLLDLGTGCGVQTLHASRHAQRLTATDLSQRALTMASNTFRLNGIDVELAEGGWFDPVAGRTFDQIVCNPPFVVGPARVDWVYRDSGLGGDAASALVVNQIPAHLSPGGVGQLLASWLHVDGQDWRERVAGWLPDDQVDMWAVQRDVADPALYVGTWLRDTGIDPRSADGKARSRAWLDWFDENKVDGIGFGFITLRRADGEGEVVCEDLRQAYDDPLGAEAIGWLERADWLRTHGTVRGLLAARLTVPESVVLEDVSGPAEEGWSPIVRRLHRMDGPGWQHELDEIAVSLLSGCRGALPLEDVLTLLAFAHDRSVDELAGLALPAVRMLIAHGMLLPVDR